MVGQETTTELGVLTELELGTTGLELTEQAKLDVLTELELDSGNRTGTNRASKTTKRSGTRHN